MNSKVEQAFDTLRNHINFVEQENDYLRKNNSSCIDALSDFQSSGKYAGYGTVGDYIWDTVPKVTEALESKIASLTSELAEAENDSIYPMLDKYQRAVGNLFWYGRPYDRFMKPGRTITECLTLFAAEFEEIKAERDALLAERENGVQVYGIVNDDGTLFFGDVSSSDSYDDSTGILICIQPIDERKGESDRRVKPNCGHARDRKGFVSLPDFPKTRNYLPAETIRTVEHARSNCRRKVYGTMADRVNK